MGLLDGVLKSVFNSAFSPILLDGLIYKATRTAGVGGRYTIAYAAGVACKICETAVNKELRDQGNYNETQSGLLVLRGSTTVTDLATDDQVTCRGVRYTVLGPVLVDPAQVTWIFRGVPVQP